MSVLSVQNLSLSFGENELFSKVSFEIGNNEKVGLVGVNGAGKTSLFKLITGEYSPDEGGVFKSSDCVLGYMEQHTCSQNRSVWEELVSVFSDLSQIEKELEVINKELEKGTPLLDNLIKKQDFLTEKFNREGGLTYKSRTRSALIGLGFSEKDFNKETSKLSGGQRSKLILAKLLLSNCNFILLDEPTNHLDVNAIEWLEGFLKDFKGALLIVSHDRYFLDKITDKTIQIENKKAISYKGNYSVFLEKKEREQKAIEEKYNNDLKEIERLEGIIAQQRQWNREKNIKTAESKEKVIERIKAQMVVPDKQVQKIRFSFTPKAVSGEDVLSADCLSKSFKDKQVFTNVSFEIKKGERVFLLGENGCGKTTLLKILMGELSQDSGSFKFGSNLFCGYFDQVQAKLDLEKTALEEVWSAFPAMTETQIRSSLAAFLFKGDEVYKKLSSCSGGERARVALLKLMLGGYNLLLLDEPTNHLDSFSRGELEKTLLNYSGTMLIVSHDRYFINKLATRIIELTSDGVNAFSGNYDDYAERRTVKAVQKAERKDNSQNDYKLRKERNSKIRKLKTALEKVQSDIELTEEKIELTESEIASEKALSDYELLTEKTNELSELQVKLNSLYEEWESLDNELTLVDT